MLKVKTNMIPGDRGVYRLKIPLPFGVSTALIEKLWPQYIKPKIVESLKNSPFTLGMFYHAEIGPDGTPQFRSPNWQQTDFLAGEQFEQNFFYMDNVQAWFEPGNCISISSDGGLTTHALQFYYILSEKLDQGTVYESMIIDKDGTIVQGQDSLGIGPIAALALVLQWLVVLVNILTMILAAVGIYYAVVETKKYLDIFFTYVGDFIDKIKRAGKKAYDWVVREKRKVEDSLRKLGKASGFGETLTTLALVGLVLWGGYKLLLEKRE